MPFRFVGTGRGGRLLTEADKKRCSQRLAYEEGQHPILKESRMDRREGNTTVSRSLGPLSDATLVALNDALRGVRYGTVTLVIQDGKVVQIDRTDRHRLKTETNGH